MNPQRPSERDISFLMNLYHQFKCSLVLTILFTVVTGLAYPLFITGMAMLFFKEKAEGSFIQVDGKIVGSELLGQFFDDPKYFWGRPSATTTFPYNAMASNASNLSPLNPELKKSIQKRIETFHRVQGEAKSPIPLDLLMASGSGLDPHISPASAFYQAPRIAVIRSLAEKEINDLIQKSIEKRQFGFLGEPRVNVLKLNLALDNLPKGAKK